MFLEILIYINEDSLKNKQKTKFPELGKEGYYPPLWDNFGLIGQFRLPSFQGDLLPEKRHFCSELGDSSFSGMKHSAEGNDRAGEVPTSTPGTTRSTQQASVEGPGQVRGCWRCCSHTGVLCTVSLWPRQGTRHTASLLQRQLMVPYSQGLFLY